MTTIAFDGKTLAADTLITQEGTIFGHQPKCFRLENGDLFAAAGSTALTHQFKQWIERGAVKSDAPPHNDRGFEGILIRNGEAFEITKQGELFPACVPWAGGSGGIHALAAMRLGKNAAEAVQFATEMDIYSGGKVVSLEVKQP